MRENWHLTTIGNICEVVNGGTPKTNVAEYWGGDYPWITPAEMGKRTNPYVARTVRSLTESGLGESSARLIPPFSVILSSRAPIGHLVINTELMATNQGCKGLVPSKSLDHKFLFYYLGSIIDVLNELGTGTTFKELSGTRLKEVPLPLPPLAEQKCIVAILDEAFAGIFAAIVNAEKNLENALQLFDSYLNALFVRRGDGWITEKLEALIDISHGFAFDGSDFATSSDPEKSIVLTPGNYTERAELSFTPKNTKRFTGNPPAAYLFNQGDLTIVMTDLSSKMKILGKPAFVRQSNILHNQRIGRIRPKNNGVSLDYLYYFLQTNKVSEEIKKTSTGTMVRHTAPKRILSMEMPFPKNTSERKTIAARLDELSKQSEKLAAVYREKLVKLGELRQAIIAKAFAGELTSRSFAAGKEAAE